MVFALHPFIERDSRLITREHGIQIRLQNHAPLPWLVLVPEQAGAVELIDLNDDLRVQLNCQQDRVCRVLQSELNADKLNVATIGNLVPQLHLHCIGRFQGDPHWPAPVWGNPLIPYTDIDHAIQLWQERLLRHN